MENMKKEIIIVFVILIIIVVGHIITQNHTNDFFDNISKDLDKIEEKIYNNSFDGEKLEKEIRKIMEKWNIKYDYFACYIEHDELEKVQTQLISIRANIMVGDYDKSVDEIERCKFILKHIEEKDSLKVINIF